MLRNLRNLVSIQFKEFMREPEILFWSLVFPIVLSWLLGIAIGSGGKQMHNAAVVGPAGAPADSDIVWMESVTGGVAARIDPAGRPGAAEKAGDVSEAEKLQRVRLHPLSKEEALLALKKGKVSLLAERTPDGTLKYSFDPRSGEAEMTWMILDRAMAGLEIESENSAIDVLETPGTRYIDFLVPGLLAMNIMNSAMWGVGWSMIEIRMKKLLRRMAATPMNKLLFLGSHFITRVLVNIIEFAALYVFVYFYFGVRIQGSIPALMAVFIAGNLAFTGIAVMISSRTANSRVGNGLINAVNMPMMLVSGIFFSYHNFPEWAVPIVRKLPLTMLADSMRSIFNEGAGFAQVWLPVAVLTAMGMVLFYAGSRVFKWY
jgi:ABC-type multidrug transport system permease subunit